MCAKRTYQTQYSGHFWHRIREKRFFFYKPTKPKKETYDIFSKITQHRSRGSRSPTTDVDYVVIHWFFSYSFNIFLFLLLSTGPDQWTKCLSLGSVTFASRQPLDNELNWILSLWRAICACLNTQLHDTHENKKQKEKKTHDKWAQVKNTWLILFVYGTTFAIWCIPFVAALLIKPWLKSVQCQYGKCISMYP